MVRLTLPYKARKYITILLFIILGFFLFKSAYAVYDPNPKHSKWFHDSIVNDPLTKSAVEVKAQRTYPVTVVDPATGAKDTITKAQRTIIKLAPPVANVGKKLLKGGAQVAIATAVYDILGKTVDWVMDPENNAVKYKEPYDPTTGSGANYGWTFQYGDGAGKFFSSPEAACQYKYPGGSPTIASYTHMEDGYCYYERYGRPPVRDQAPIYVSNPNPDSGGSSPEYKRIPIDQVAQKVIDNAAAGDGPSMEVMSNTALDMLEQGLLDAALEAAADPKDFAANESDPFGASTPDPSDPTDPDTQCPSGYKKEPSGTCVKTEQTGSELPPFCAWATKVCDFIDWVQTPPSDPEDGAGDIEIEKPDPDMHVGILERLYIDMPAECPPDPVLEFMGAKIPFPMSVFCQFASMMKPLILLFAYIKGLSIIGNGLN